MYLPEQVTTVLIEINSLLIIKIVEIQNRIVQERSNQARSDSLEGRIFSGSHRIIDKSGHAFRERVADVRFRCHFDAGSASRYI